MPRHYYGIRRFSPYQGVVQVVDVGHARAYSTDGRHWQVRIQQEPGGARWSGVWTAGVPAESAAVRTTPAEDLMDALQHRPPHPFPLEDRFELWLLHKQTRLPLALLKTRRAREDVGPVEDPVWRPFLLHDNSFVSSVLQEQAAERPAGAGARHRDVLERQVNQAARPQPMAQWFERRSDGGGTGLEGLRVEGELLGRRLPREAFPELLVDEVDPPGIEARLVRDYHDWNAALLLAHQHLPRVTRARLERAACRRPGRLLESYAMIPEVLDRDALDVALVSAKLIRSA